MKQSVCLYGIDRGNSSFARVTAGWRYGLSHLGLLAGFCPLDAPNVTPCEGADAPVAVLVGPPTAYDALRLMGDHKIRAVVLAPNSSYVPPGVLDALEQNATHCLATSWWARSVLRPLLRDTDVALWRVPHGVRPDQYRQLALAVERQETGLRVLHLTTTAGQRKGTAELLTAWRKVARQLPGSRLTIVSDNASVADESETIKVVQRQNMTERQAVVLYRQHDVVCQPSRAEGFGLVPLEAAAAGCVTVVTAATGHDDYVQHGWWNGGHVLIETSDAGPIDDGPGATAPTVQPDAIVKGLIEAAATFRVRRRMAEVIANILQAYWDWPHVLLDSGFVDKIESEFA